MIRRHRAFIFGLVLCAGVLAALTGCASIAARIDEYDDDGYYPGVRDDIGYLRHPEDARYPYLQWLNIIDLPFSFVTDTACLPYEYFTREPEEEEE